MGPAPSLRNYEVDGAAPSASESGAVVVRLGLQLYAAESRELRNREIPDGRWVVGRNGAHRPPGRDVDEDEGGGIVGANVVLAARTFGVGSGGG